VTEATEPEYKLDDSVTERKSLAPTAKDTSFVPYILGLDLRFEVCLPDTLVQEGGYSNDAHDPGGMTMKGIIQREYDAKRRQWGLPTQWVRKISDDEMRTIYYTDYWLPYCPHLPAGLDLEFFDLDVNGGPHRAVVTLQRALLITDDGMFGPATQAAVDTVVSKGQDAILSLIESFKAQREAFYRALATFRYFGTDWIRRSEEIAKQGEAMA
jgi:lysozyme family protein